jgi:two-component system, cell cycle sensor histidine kinase and response regulator CckA
MSIKVGSLILAVDDEPDTLSLLQGILAPEGYDVRSADSGRLALASLDAWLPALILLDIRMKDMDGFEVLRQLKAREKSRNIPVMFISAASEIEERVKGLTLGAVDYVSKPFQREELLARVRTHLDLARLRHNLEHEVSRRTAELSVSVERLRESEDRFRNMADTAPVMIWVSGTDKQRSFFNKTWLTFTGRGMEEELGDGWTKSVHPADLEHCFESYTSSFGHHRNFQLEYRLRRADGEFRWVLDKGVPRFAPSGVFAGFIGSAIDITDLKRVQEEALSKEKLESLTSLTRGIAHDFNNMLATILVLLELAQTDLPEESTTREGLRQIHTIATRASEVVRELMIYSGQEQAKLTPVDLSGLVEEMSQLLKASISKHATLRLNLSNDLPQILGNAAQIRQLVMNLIMNASQAIAEKEGVIHVETSFIASSRNSNPEGADSADDYVRLAVTDTGCGMTEQQRARIFDPFFTTKPQGHGLGLAVVHGIVQSHNAVINVDSTPGRGTTFQILFRRTEAQVETASASPAAFAITTGEPRELSGMVLFVEDQDVLRVAITTALQRAGFTVLSAADGLTAVETFRARADDIGVVVLDLTLPGLSGQEVFRRIRGLKPEVRVIIASAHDCGRAEAILPTEPGVTFLQKPYGFSDLRRELCPGEPLPVLRAGTGGLNQFD